MIVQRCKVRHLHQAGTVSRAYATSVGNRRANLTKDTPLTLEHFLQRSRALSLWRDIMRSVQKIPRSTLRQEMRNFARDEFERTRHITDVGHVRYLISTGRAQLESMQRYVEQDNV